MDSATATVHGQCAPGFEPVREAFEENFRSRGELGAAFTAIRHGEVVADLWGGWSGPDRTRPWQPDTLANVWSTTKGMTALCAHKLADAGELDVDAPVAKYWPEFAAAGKSAIPVRWLLSHRSGVPGIGLERPVRVEELYDWDLMTSLLAAQEPLSEPVPPAVTTRWPTAGSSAKSSAGSPGRASASSSPSRSPSRSGPTSRSASPKTPTSIAARPWWTPS